MSHQLRHYGFPYSEADSVQLPLGLFDPLRALPRRLRPRDALGAPLVNDQKRPCTWWYALESGECGKFELPGVWLRANELFLVVLKWRALAKAGQGSARPGRQVIRNSWFQVARLQGAAEILMLATTQGLALGYFLAPWLGAEGRRLVCFRIGEPTLRFKSVALRFREPTLGVKSVALRFCEPKLGVKSVAFRFREPTLGVKSVALRFREPALGV